MHFSSVFIFFNFLLGLIILSVRPIYSRLWYRIDVPHFYILFQEGFLLESTKIAKRLESLSLPWTKSLLDTQSRKISLVLNNQSTNLHGSLMTPNPRRIHCNTFPSPNPYLIGNFDWIELCMVHEGRHRMQHDLLYYHMNRNFSDFVCFMGLSDVSIPSWFPEGDAVGIETAFSKSGRGRILQWALLYRINLLERGLFSYQKQVLGSFKDQLPDYYRLGYFLTTYLRRKYGAQVIGEIYRNTAKWFLPFFSFPIAMKRVTGRSLLQIYQDAHQELLTLWKKQLKGLHVTPVKLVHTRNVSEYIDYLHPQIFDNKHIIVLKSGIGTVPQFVLVNTILPAMLVNATKNMSQPFVRVKHMQEINLSKTSQNLLKEQHLYTPVHNLSNDFNNFSVAGNKIAWVAPMLDPFRGEKKYHMAIYIFNIINKQCTKLVSKSRYNVVSLSPDANQIVAVESNMAYRHRLVILDARKGKVIRYIPNPNNYYYLTPSWSDDGRQIVAVRTNKQQSTLVLIDPKIGKENVVYPISKEHISHPKIYRHYLFYNSSCSGIDNIYVMDLRTKKRFQVTSRKYGAYHPVVSHDGAWIIFNDATKDGMDVVKIAFNPRSWMPIEKVQDRSIQYYQPLVKQENNHNVLLHPPSDVQYFIEKYKPWKHWLNLAELNIDHFAINQIACSIKFEDVLEEVAITLAYSHKFSDEKKIFHKNRFLGVIEYEGWYPMFQISGKLMGYDGRIGYVDVINGQCNTKKEVLLAMTVLQQIAVALKFPYYFQGGPLVKSNITLGIENEVGKCNDPDSNRSMWTQSYNVTFVHDAIQSKRDLYPPYKQEIFVMYGHTPYSFGNVKKEKVKLKANLFFPGFCKNNSFMVKILGSIREGNCLAPKENKQMLPWSVVYGKFTYAFPLFYPDWSEGLLFYLKRMHLEITYKGRYSTFDSLHDHAQDNVQDAKNIKHRHFVKCKLFLDTYFFSLSYCFRLGISIKYLIFDACNSMQWTPSLNFNILK